MTIVCGRVMFNAAVVLVLIAFFISEGTWALGGVKEGKPKPLPSLVVDETTAARARRIRTTNATTTKSYVELFDPKTNTEIILLGCLHGSLSSSIDVKNLLLGELQEQQTSGGDVAGASNLEQEEEQFLVPDVVVLELCKPRYEGIVASREEIIDEYSSEDFWEDLTNYWKRTFQENNDNPILALVKTMLGTTSLVQTQLSGIRAGLEFEVAMDIVEAYNNNNFRNKNSDNNNNNSKRDNANNDDKVVRLVLGDRNVDETMDRIVSLPSVSLQLIRGNGTNKGTNGGPITNIWRESNRVWTAILGDRTLPKNSQICMPKVLLRNPQAKKDLGRQLLIPSLVATGMALVLAWIARGFEPDPYDVLLWDTLLSFNDDGIELQTKISAVSALSMNSLSDLVALLAGYILLALPASKVIVSERDVVLKESIIEAIVSSSSQQFAHQPEEEPPLPSRKIVGILGLLHVNGVSKQLLEECGFVTAGDKP